MPEINIVKFGEGSFPVTLQEAEAGDEIVYHVGPFASGPHKSDALRAALDGSCFILQRKMGNGKFAYIAVKATDKYKKNHTQKR